jgi:drug/metabolite transporter (DMT)-like permease
VSAAPPATLIAVALAIVYLVWGSTYLGIRVMVEHLPPLASAGWRYLAASVVLGALLIAKYGWRRLVATPRQLAGCAALGVLLPALGNGVVSTGESMGAPSGIAALIVAAVPLWIIVYRVIAGDRPQSRTVLGVLIGFAGLVGLIAATGIGGELKVTPLLIIGFATVCWSFGSWSMPRLPLPADPFVVTVYEMLFGGVALTIMALVDGQNVIPEGGTPRAWIAWAYLVVFGSVVAFTAYVWVLDKAPISLVATYAYVNPVVAVFLGWIILSESVTPAILIGGAVAVAGVALVVASERRPKTPEAT